MFGGSAGVGECAEICRPGLRLADGSDVGERTARVGWGSMGGEFFRCGGRDLEEAV